MVAPVVLVVAADVVVVAADVVLVTGCELVVVAAVVVDVAADVVVVSTTSSRHACVLRVSVAQQSSQWLLTYQQFSYNELQWYKSDPRYSHTTRRVVAI